MIAPLSLSAFQLLQLTGRSLWRVATLFLTAVVNNSMVKFILSSLGTWIVNIVWPDLIRWCLLFMHWCIASCDLSDCLWQETTTTLWMKYRVLSHCIPLSKMLTISLAHTLSISFYQKLLLLYKCPINIRYIMLLRLSALPVFNSDNSCFFHPFYKGTAFFFS